MMFIIMCCIFSFTWIVRFYEVVELLWWYCWCLYMLCAYMLVNFYTCYWGWIVSVSMYWNMLVWIVEVVWNMHCCCWVISPHTVDVEFHIHVGDKYFVFNYSGCLWCSVGIRGHDLIVDLVPHVSRVGLGTLHV